MTQVGEPIAAFQNSNELNDWIEVRLLDHTGKGVGRARYRVTLPNNAACEGLLDEDGAVRLEGIPSGKCKIEFPDYDAGDWDRKKFKAKSSQAKGP